MENNNAAQRSTHNAQRGSYPAHNNRSGWNRGNSFKDEKQPPKSIDQTPNAASAENHSGIQKTVRTFRDLAIWQKGISLVKTIYQKTSAFPKDELYGLIAQMRRAAVSVPSNIAEGYRRRHGKEFQQFLNISLGSLGELETQIIVSGELSYLSEENHSFLLEEIDHLTRMIISLSQKVDR